MTETEAPGTPDVRTVDFGGLAIAYDDRVLTPRSWTLAQSRWAADLLTGLPPGRVLELCTGAGQIGLRAVVDSARELVCVDADEVAISYLTRNAAAAGLGDRVEARHGLMDEVVAPEEEFPLVIADPPWVRRTATGAFPEDPLLAIDGGEDGLDVARICLRVIEGHLAPGGSALLQVGPDQADQVAQLCAPGPLKVTETRSFDRGVLLRLDRS